MKIKKYRAADSQQAMRLIRAEQGPDASILTCYQVPEGIEFVVALNCPGLDDVDLPPAAAAGMGRQKIDDRQVAEGDRDMLTLRQELGSMRTLLERHLHRLAVREPLPLVTAAATLPGRLSLSGFSGPLLQRLRALVPETGGREALAEALRASLSDVVCAAWPAQGVSALIGPSGAGKSHLLATLALQHVLSGSRQPLYLVSCDQQRFGAREQLQALGRVLRLPVLFAGDAEVLREELAALPGNARVLLDTAGVDHGDGAGLAALGALLDTAGISHRALVMPLDMAEAVQHDTLAAYAALTPSGVVATRGDTLAAAALASWLCRAGMPWLGACAGRDPATAWRAADIDALIAGLLPAWADTAADTAASTSAGARVAAGAEADAALMAPAMPATVSRWSWTSQRISA